MGTLAPWRWRVAPSPEAEVAVDDPLARSKPMARVEAVLMFADEPITTRKLAEIAGLEDGHEARRLIEQLKALYIADDSPFQVEEVGGGVMLFSQPKYYPWLIRYRRTGADSHLSAAALETLAVVAYKQPLTRADLEAVRGVSCAELLRQLMERGFVRVTGRHQSLGRPQLYGTTKKFLMHFGLNHISELPSAPALQGPRS
jgi:segregation and condensation protein B